MTLSRPRRYWYPPVVVVVVIVKTLESFPTSYCLLSCLFRFLSGGLESWGGVAQQPDRLLLRRRDDTGVAAVLLHCGGSGNGDGGEQVRKRVTVAGLPCMSGG